MSDDDSLTGGNATSGASVSAGPIGVDDFPLHIGDVVLVKSTIWAESQNFLHFMRRQSGSRTALSKGAVLRVADVIVASGGFVLNLANLFDDEKARDAHTRQLLGEESMIFCSEGDEKKLQVIQRQQQDHFHETEYQQEQRQPAKNDDTEDADEGAEEEEDPMTLMDCASYAEITGILTTANLLPIDLAEQAATFLQVESVDASEVSIRRASSSRGDFPLSSVLGNEDGTWWISAESSMENGRGEEFLEFSLSPDGTARRCCYVGISIPPLPQGPLSVRRFRIDWSYNGTEWTMGCRRYTMETMDIAGMQTFQLERPVDAAMIRLVCLTNAFASEQDRRGRGGLTPFECVGLFFVRWK